MSALALGQSEALGTPMSAHPIPMEVNNVGQMNLKALLETHIMGNPLESAFHG